MNIRLGRSGASRSRVVCLVVGLSFLLEAGAGFAVSQASARAASGHELQSFDVSATAPGVQLTEDEPGAQTHPEAEAEIAQSVVQLRNGPIGYGLSTIAWPGATAANAGSLLLLVGDPVPGGPPFPEQLTALNDPVRAEARTGSGTSTQHNDTYPGVSMSASAADSHVSADADLQAVDEATSGTSVGNITTSSTSTLTGGAAVATATSRVEHISLAGGAVTIDSVVSTARATTDGVKAAATGHTVVAGLRIAGQDVTIDQSGIHVSGQGAPANSAAADAVNSVVSQLGMHVALSQPSGKPQGSSVSYNAGSLVFLWTLPNDPSDNVFTATFGGATIGVAASLSSPFAITNVPLGPLANSATHGAVGGSAASPPGVSAPSSADVGASAPPPVVASPASDTPALSTRSFSLAGGVSPVWIVLAIAGSALIALAVGRLPDHLFGIAELPCEVKDG